MRRFGTALALILASTVLTSPAVALAPQGPGSGRLTNLAHLDFLRDSVAPPSQPGHTTYRLAQEPAVGTLWTYADRRDDGTFERVGGGAKDAQGDYEQGAFNADDLARAVVVYVRHWRQTGSSTSRRSAYELLRGLTYLQTTTGSHAGEVVLWMQPDGTLNASAKPVEQPDPSDSGPSYWTARTVWALGEAYAAFRTADPGFATFLKQRMDLSVRALQRDVLTRYDSFEGVDGRRTPRWLVVDEAGASAEAVLGLSSYVQAGGGAAARRALRQLATGIASLGAGDARHWPFGAVLPSATSRSQWHAWASQMPAALFRASSILGQPSLRRVAARDSFTFDPWLLTSGGPDNGRSPTPVDTTQIAYGIDSRVQSLLASGTHAGTRLAGLTAAWFFGANASGEPAYDPATGVTLDGVAPDGTPNPNSGAESTIHGLLTMLALDAHPEAARIARTATVTARVAPTTLQAEDAHLTGGAIVVQPPELATGESQLGGTGYASLPAGGRVRFDLARHGGALVVPVVDLRPGSRARARFTGGGFLGLVRSGAVGPQGASPAPGALLPVTLARTLRARAQHLTAAGSRGTTRLDAVVVQPLVTRLVLGGGGHGTALLRSSARHARSVRVGVPGRGRAVTWSYDGRGRLLARRSTAAHLVRVRVVAGGFTLVRR